MFKLEASIFVKATAAALSVCVAITGLTALGTSSIANVEVCYGDFIQFCYPIEPPALALFLLAAGAVMALWVFAKMQHSSRDLRHTTARSQ